MVFFVLRSSKAVCAQVSDRRLFIKSNISQISLFFFFRCVGRNRCCCIRSAEAVDGAQTGQKLKRMWLIRTLEGQTKWIQAEMCETHGNQYLQIGSLVVWHGTFKLNSAGALVKIKRKCVPLTRSVGQTAIMAVVQTAYNASNLSPLAATKRNCFTVLSFYSAFPCGDLEKHWRNVSETMRAIHAHISRSYFALSHGVWRHRVPSNAFLVLRMLFCRALSFGLLFISAAHGIK